MIRLPSIGDIAETLHINDLVQRWLNFRQASRLFIAAIVDQNGVCLTIFEVNPTTDSPEPLSNGDDLWKYLPKAVHEDLASVLKQSFPLHSQHAFTLPATAGAATPIEFLINQLPAQSQQPRFLLLAKDRQALPANHVLSNESEFDTYFRGIVICDSGQNIIQINQTFSYITGYTRAEIIGQNSRIKQGPLTDPAMVDEIRQTLKHKKSFNGQLVNYRKDGSPFLNALSIQTVLNAEGEVAYYLGMLSDVTGKLLHDQQESMVEALFSQFPYGLCVINRARMLMDSNQMFARLTGYAAHEMMGSKLDAFVDTAAEVWPSMLHAFERLEPLHVEIKMRHANTGNDVWCEMTLTPVLHASSPVYIVLIQDITQRKRFESSLLQQERFQQTLFDHFPAMIWFKDASGKFLAVNRGYLEVCGVSNPGDFIGQSEHFFWPPDVANQLQEQDQLILQGHSPSTIDEAITLHEETRWFETYRAPVILNGKLLGCVGIAQEMTERRQHAAYERFKLSMLEMVVNEHDAGSSIEKIARGIQELLPDCFCAIGLNEDVGQLVKAVIAPNLPTIFFDALKQLRVEKGNGSLGTAISIKQRVIVEDVNTHPYWIHHRDVANKAGIKAGWAEPIINANGDVLGAMGIYYKKNKAPSNQEQSLVVQAAKIISILLEKYITHDRIQTMARRDFVSGLPNRRQVNEFLLAIRNTPPQAMHWALIYIDLDHFKWINDALGYTLGNLLLSQVAERLKALIGSQFIASMGGDEFLIVLSGLDENEAVAELQMLDMQRLLHKSFARHYKVEGKKLYMNASFGLGLFKDSLIRDVDCVEAVDIAMHKAKLAGRNTFRIYHPEMQAEVSTQVMLENQLRFATEQQQLQLHYQVQVDHNGRPFGAEALLRWDHPQHGLISPAQFVPIAEATGLIIDMGKWVIEQACAQIAKWQSDARTGELSLSVNISGRQLRQSNFIATVKSSIQRYNINPNALRLELTESVLLENIDEAVRIMTELSQLGIQFSLDDFGTGYSSLQYLKKLPLYQLKIDRSFVNDIVTDSHDRTIVRTIIAMAQSMYLGVIAEGVENEGQKELLLNYGCRRYQGFLFGKPMPIDAFNQMLKTAFS